MSALPRMGAQETLDQGFWFAGSSRLVLASPPMTPSRTSLEAMINACGIVLSAAQYDRLWAYHRLLRAANAELNLTRIHNFESMVLKHYVDSLLILKFAELPSPLIDLGSGPGLPGIPLKIARPEIEMILAEPRGRGPSSSRRSASELRLEGIEVLRRQGRPAIPEDCRRNHHPRVRVDPRDARPRGELPRAWRANALHEGSGLRRRDRRGAAVTRRILPDGRRPRLPDPRHARTIADS